MSLTSTSNPLTTPRQIFRTSLSEKREIYGIQLFDDANTCISNFENISKIKRTISFTVSWGTFFIFCLYRMNLIFRGKMHRIAKDENVDFNKKKLIVCIHGCF